MKKEYVIQIRFRLGYFRYGENSCGKEIYPIDKKGDRLIESNSKLFLLDDLNKVSWSDKEFFTYTYL